MRGFGIGRSGGGLAAKRRGMFGIALECDPRGQTGEAVGVFAKPETDDFVEDAIYEVGTFLKGANWQLYKTAAVARGATPTDFVEDSTTVKPTATAVEPFLSLFDVVFVNPHQNGGVTPIQMKTVKDLRAANGPPGSRRFMATRLPDFVFHGWKDDMPTGPHTSTLWAHYYNGIKAAGLFLRGTGPNSTNGALTCDPEEVNAWPGGQVKDVFASPPTETPFGSVSGHNWHVDYTHPAFAGELARLAVEQWRTYWNASAGAGEPLDHYVAHDVMPRYPARAGSATNLPTFTDEQWIPPTSRIPLAYEAAFKGLSPTLGRLWSATGGFPGRTWPGTDDIPTLGGIFYNYQWSSASGTTEQFAADVARAASREIPIAFGSDAVHASLEALFETPDHPDWWTMLAAARRRDWEENTYIACRGTGGGGVTGYLFWTPAMRPIA